MQQITPQEEQEIVDKLSSKSWRMNNLYYVVNELGQTVPFRFNSIQARIQKEASRYRDIILKYRQGGVSTYKIIDLVDDTVFGWTNHSNYFVTHRQDLLDEFFKKAKFTLDTIDLSVRHMIEKPSTKNANELYFEETNNTLRIGLDVRGRTPTNLHISEFWPMGAEKQKELFQQFDSFRETKITIESTAHGMGDVFHGMCMNAREWLGDFKLLFYWFDIDERNERDVPDGFTLTDEESLFMGNHLSKYPIEQATRKMVWRRKRIETANALGEDWRSKFSEENPITIDDAFISSGSGVFDMKQPFKIQQPTSTIEWFKIYLPVQDQLVIGVDIAEWGSKGDYSAISARNHNGQVAFQYKGRVSEVILAQKLDYILTQYKEDDKCFMGTIQPENNVGLAFINECKKYDWFQYVLKSRQGDRAEWEDLIQKYGFRTTKQSKDLIIREYRMALYNQEISITPDLHSEMSTYQYDKENRANAIAPNHDDLLIADMIAYNAVLHEPWIVTYSVKPIDEDSLSVVERHMLRVRRGDYNREE